MRYSEFFWVLIDLTVICRFNGKFVFFSYFGVVILPDKFCEGIKPGSNFYLKNDFFYICFHEMVVT